MKKLGIYSVIRKKKKKYTYSKPDEKVENILQRDFYAYAPNQKWATDVRKIRNGRAAALSAAQVNILCCKGVYTARI